MDFHRNCTSISEREYRRQYDLFGIEFDHWERESEHRNIEYLLQLCKKRGLLFEVDSAQMIRVPCIKTGAELTIRLARREWSNYVR